MFENFVGKIAVGFIALAAVIGGLFSPPAVNQNYLGAVIPTPVASFSTTLSSKITSSDTSMTLVSVTTDDGTSLTTGKVYGFVIDANTASEEFVLGTVSSTQVVSMTRGVSVITGNTEVSALKTEHRRGASVKITDAPVLLVMARILNGDETIPNVLSYAFSSSTSITSDSQIPNKAYVDNVAYGTSTYWLPSGTNIYNSSANTISIGTSTTDQAKLYVYSTNNGGHSSSLLIEHNNASMGATLGLRSTATGGRWYQLGSDISDGSFRIYDWTASGHPARLTIASSGFIGIATTTPSTNLHIVGSSTISGNLVLGGADKVINSSGNSLVGRIIDIFSTTTAVNPGTVPTQITTTTIPGGMLGLNGGLIVEFIADMVTGGSIPAPLFNVKFGGADDIGETIYNATPGSYTMRGRATIFNRASTTAQLISYERYSNAATSNKYFYFKGGTTSNINTNINQTLNVEYYNYDSNSNTTTTFSSINIYFIPGN